MPLRPTSQPLRYQGDQRIGYSNKRKVATDCIGIESWEKLAAKYLIINQIRICEDDFGTFRFLKLGKLDNWK